MKKQIAFYLKKFLAGGIETTLTQYLMRIDPLRYEVTLVVGIKTYPVSPFISQLPNHVKIRYIIDESFFDIVPFLQHTTTKNKLHKIAYTIITKPVIKLYLRNMIVKELNKYDCIVDYSLNLDDLARKIKCRKIGYFHFRLSHHYKPNKVTKRLNRVLPMYDNVVVISEAMLKDARNLFRHCKDKFVLMYNQFDQEKILKLAKNGNTEDITNVEYVVSCGRLSESQKDFTTLINAYSIVKNIYKHNEKLIIIGTGVDYDSLQNQINRLDLCETIKLVGFRANPFHLISKAKIFILSSKHEGLPGVLIESMMLGVPILSTDCPDGPSEMLLNGDAGCLVKVGDVEQMAENIHFMLLDEQLRQRFADIATANLYRFEITHNMDKLYKIIDGLV